MKLFILSLILIGLVGLERFIYIKKDRAFKKISLLIDLLIICLLILISYLITDTAIETFYVFSAIFTFILLGAINNRSDIKWLKHLSRIIGAPLAVLLLMKAIQSMLVEFRHILLLALIVNTILSYSYEKKWTKKDNLSLIIGIAMAVVFLFSYNRLFGSDNRIMMKQEIVAKSFLEEELNMQGFDVYLRKSHVGLRGEESRVGAYDQSGTVITMIYKDNRIISYEIEDSD